MSEIVATIKCDECGAVMEGKKGEYKYTESGLTSVVLKDVLVFRCTHCNALVANIPAAGILHRVIALRLVTKKTLLTGSELRFLRKLCGYSASEFAEILGSSKTVISRWENGNVHGKGTDRTVRLLVMRKLVREVAGEPDPILRNVTVAQLDNEIVETLKLIDSRRKVTERYEIPPDEIARFGGGDLTKETPELVGGTVQ